MPLASPNMANTPLPADAELHCDVLVVGGGINGCGIARDLAGRGWRVVLAEQDDLAAHTSSSSTKLIHGGLRYLEYYEFGLVRKALLEREVLLKSAPHIMWPLRFVMPHDPAMRPAWFIRLGIFMYDHLAKREVLPGSEGVNLRTHAVGAPLQDRYTQGFVYSDGWVDDARLVVLNAIDAREQVFDRFVRFLIFGNVLRGEVYPLSVAAERTQQAISVIAVARQLQALAVAQRGRSFDQMHVCRVAHARHRPDGPQHVGHQRAAPRPQLGQSKGRGAALIQP